VNIGRSARIRIGLAAAPPERLEWVAVGGLDWGFLADRSTQRGIDGGVRGPHAGVADKRSLP
jgi:hypothetical protein